MWTNIKCKDFRFEAWGLKDDCIGGGLQRISEATSMVSYRLFCVGEIARATWHDFNLRVSYYRAQRVLNNSSQLTYRLGWACPFRSLQLFIERWGWRRSENKDHRKLFLAAVRRNSQAYLRTTQWGGHQGNYAIISRWKRRQAHKATRVCHQRNFRLPISCRHCQADAFLPLAVHQDCNLSVLGRRLNADHVDRGCAGDTSTKEQKERRHCKRFHLRELPG